MEDLVSQNLDLSCGPVAGMDADRRVPVGEDQRPCRWAVGPKVVLHLLEQRRRPALGVVGDWVDHRIAKTVPEQHQPLSGRSGPKAQQRVGHLARGRIIRSGNDRPGRIEHAGTHSVYRDRRGLMKKDAHVPLGCQGIEELHEGRTARDRGHPEQRHPLGNLVGACAVS